MSKIKVIKNIPTKLPISSFVLYTFLMEYYNLSEFWKGVVYVLMFIIFSICVYAIWNEEKVDFFSETKRKIEFEPKIKSTFEERVKEMQGKINNQ